MKNFTLLSLVAASLLFTACGDKTKEAATDAASFVFSPHAVNNNVAVTSESNVKFFILFL